MSPNWFTAEPATPAALVQNDNCYRQYLHNLLAVGDSLATALPELARTAKPANPAAAALDLATAFDRIACAMRRTILLARSLAEPPLTTRHAPQAAAHPRAADRTRHSAVPERPDPPDRPDRIDKLDRIDTLDDISGPIAELIAEIAADLGVPNPWQPAPDADFPTATAQPGARPADPAGSPPAASARTDHPATPPPDG